MLLLFLYFVFTYGLLISQLELAAAATIKAPTPLSLRAWEASP
jgi:hypothetical protein